MISRAKRVSLFNLKMSTTAISLRLPQGFFDRIKVAAKTRDVPHQSLIKVGLAEKVDVE
jgi:predicted DNA binding CopG/RHH family protein